MTRSELIDRICQAVGIAAIAAVILLCAWAYAWDTLNAPIAAAPTPSVDRQP